MGAEEKKDKITATVDLLPSETKTLQFELIPDMTGEDLTLLPPSYEIAGKTFEGHYSVRAIRVMAEYEYRMTIADNSDVWLVFLFLFVASIAFPLLMWLYASKRNLKLKVN